MDVSQQAPIGSREGVQNVVLQQNLLNGSQGGVMGYGVIGNTVDFDSIILGSNPSTPAKKDTML